MTKKIVFIDVDGTLCNNEGDVPASAKKAVIEARKNGHLLYLCTGRSKAEIYDFIWEIGFDGVIGAGGGYVQIGDDMLFHKKVADKDVRHLVDFFNEHGVDFYLESNGGLYSSKNLVNHLHHILYGDIDNDPIAKEKSLQPNHFIDNMTHGEANLYKNDVNKACFIECKDIPFEVIKKEFENEFDVIQCTVPAFGEDSGELMVPGVSKSNAIKALLDHLGMSQEDTLAIGDGMNDVDMLEFCHIGIAMGNAKQGLKDIADYITDSHDDNGIYNAFKKYGLI